MDDDDIGEYSYRDGQWLPARKATAPLVQDWLRHSGPPELRELTRGQQDILRSFYDPRSTPARPQTLHGGTVYYVPELSVVQERDMPGFRSMDMRKIGEGVMVLDRDGVVWKAITPAGYLQRSWFSLGPVFPADVQLEFDAGINSTGYADMTPDPFSASRGVLRIGGDDLAGLVQYWFGEPDVLGRTCAGASQMAAAFVDELLTQMHRPAKERIGTVQIVKHPTRRGRASDREVDPLTPWALRAGAQRLLQEVTSSTRADAHEADGTYLKRVLDIRARREALLQQLAEVDSYLTATEAILVRQDVSA